MPACELDCGLKCGPHNVGGKPFCCDICHAVPTAYHAEWEYLQANTNLWKEWLTDSCADTPEQAQEEYLALREETPASMLLIECLGPEACERDYRSLTCRQFPFFPYINALGQFLGLAYYWAYEDSCWLINNLEYVSKAYRLAFIENFEQIFASMPEERENFQYHSERMRQEFSLDKRKIAILHRDGQNYLLQPEDEKIMPVDLAALPKHGPYDVVAAMPFPDEME